MAVEALGDRAWVRSQLAAAALRRQLAEGGRAVLRVHGNSMRPLLPAGARVALRAARDDADLRGAVVAVEGGGVVVVHRVVTVDGGRVVTRGLGSAKADPARSRDAVIGVVCARLDGPWPLGRESVLRVLAALAATAYRLRARL